MELCDVISSHELKLHRVLSLLASVEKNNYHGYLNIVVVTVMSIRQDRKIDTDTRPHY